MPDFIAEVARMRRDGVADRDIAAHLGVGRKYMQGRVSEWRRKNPDADMPFAATRERPAYAQVARLSSERALSIPQIAAETGYSESTVATYLHKARKHGVLPPRTSRLEGDGLAAWAHYYQKGAAPPRGYIGAILMRLTPEQFVRVLQQQTQDDTTVADVFARIIREHLDAETAP